MQALIISYINCKVWNEMTYPIPNFNDAAAVEVWKIPYVISKVMLIPVLSEPIHLTKGHMHKGLLLFNSIATY